MNLRGEEARFGTVEGAVNSIPSSLGAFLLLVSFLKGRLKGRNEAVQLWTEDASAVERSSLSRNERTQLVEDVEDVVQTEARSY